MDNTIQLYVDKKKGIKGYPITSPDRVIDENGVNIEEKLDNIVSQLPNDLATKDYVDEAINNAKLEGGDVQVDLSTYAKKTDLHSHSNKTVLDSITASKVNQWDSKSDFSGNYNDLTNKPTIPSLNGYATEQYVNEEIKKIDVTEQLTDYAKKSELHSHSNKSVLDGITSAKITEWDSKSDFSGNYNDLTNKPTIPTKVSDLPNDSGYLTEHQDISGKVDKVDGKSLISDDEIDRLATLENYDDTEVRELIDEINLSLENITNRVEYIENNGSGGGSTGVSLNLRDVLDGEIFTIGTIDIPTTPTVTYGQIVVSKSSTTITEGSTDTFTIKLDKAPTNNQVVTLNKNNSDVTLSSYSLTFTPSNYSTAQTVTITVAEDNTDYSNETCTITISSPNVSTKTLIVNITDNDTEVNEPDEPEIPTPTNYINYIYNSDTYTSPTDISQHPISSNNKSIYWQAYKATKTVSNGIATVLFNGSGFFQCRPNTGDGKTYYYSYLVDTASSSYVTCHICANLAKYTKDLGNGWTLYASVEIDSNANFNSKIVDNRTSDWTPIQTKEWMKICLTDLYPDGNFPSVEECSNLFEYVSGIQG